MLWPLGRHARHLRSPSVTTNAMGLLFLDSQPDQVINVAKQFDFTGDLKWLRTHQATCERVLDYMLRRDSNRNGLVEMHDQQP